MAGKGLQLRLGRSRPTGIVRVAIANAAPVFAFVLLGARRRRAAANAPCRSPIVGERCAATVREFRMLSRTCRIDALARTPALGERCDHAGRLMSARASGVGGQRLSPRAAAALRASCAPARPGCRPANACLPASIHRRGSREPERPSAGASGGVHHIDDGGRWGRGAAQSFGDWKGIPA